MAADNKEFKYGVRELASEMGIQEASARVALRNKGIQKAGKSYGWNSQEEMKKVANKLRGAVAPEPKVKKKVRAAA